MGTKIMNAFEDREISSIGETETPGNMSEDFENMTYDNHFKNVFSIKRILAVVIRETIDLYADCTIDEVVGLIEVSEPASTALTAGLEKIASSESHAVGEGSVYFDVFVKVKLPWYADKNLYTAPCFCIKLDTEMQRKLNPGYVLSKRGLYYGSRMITEQLPVINKDTNYDLIAPVYSIWITLVSKGSGLAGRVIKYQIENVGVSGGNENELYGNKALCKLDTVTNLMNIYFICIDKDIVNNSDAVINLQGITEYISLMFAGKFQDSRLREHDYAFDDVVAMYGKELAEMSSYMSEVAEERAEARAEGREEGREEAENRIILNMYSKGYNAEVIAELCDVDLKTVNSILNI
ncbi:MAG: hypothetical protein HFH67_17925 [Lachnospiraceae bacterium]|nr:hypothetical protein [Lachnospiraceae bacterium]